MTIVYSVETWQNINTVTRRSEETAAGRSVYVCLSISYDGYTDAMSIRAPWHRWSLPSFRVDSTTAMLLWLAPINSLSSTVLLGVVPVAVWPRLPGAALLVTSRPLDSVTLALLLVFTVHSNHCCLCSWVSSWRLSITQQRSSTRHRSTTEQNQAQRIA